MSMSLLKYSCLRSGLWIPCLIATLAFTSLASAQKYVQTNLVSDIPGWAATTDPNLVNCWGIAFSPGSPAWFADNGSGLSTLYSGSSIIPLVVTVPPPGGSTGTSAPTGTVFNGGGAFNVTANSLSGSSVFMFDTEDGTISGWSPSVDAHNAALAVDNSNGGAGAVYKGLAIGTTPDGTFIYATNFRSGWVEMYDSNFKWVKNFTDTELPMGYAPFGIQNINGKLYVTYALQDEAKHDDVAGLGHGFVDIFDTHGNRLKRLVSHGWLNSPWGLAQAPWNFGKFSGALLVGNFGDGHISAYNISSGAFLGQMIRPAGTTLEIQGLWGLAFGNGAAAGPTNTLLFTSGPNHEADGLYGTLVAK
jgi:uncharacterized protein (TIGR03118 family)